MRSGHPRLLAAVFLLVASCQKTPEVTVLGAQSEPELREKIGIPPEAKRVILFGQNAHMDLDWQLTFPEYYDRYVEKIIGQTLDILDENPRYFYSMAEMAFLKYHLEKHPEDRERLKRHTKTGRFRIVGGGITSPDVVLPTGEALLRDFMYGRRFTLEEFGVGSVSAWLPDDFGLGSGLPSLLTAAGYKYAALSRADGIDNFLLPNMKYTPRPGSTAEKLLNEKAIDFWWKGADGTRILTHWMPYTYCQGDNIDYDEPFQLPGGHLGPFKPDAESTNGKIAMYVSQLADVSPTDYMFVPVGCDFAMPKPRLVEYMDHWNEMKYPETGVWAVAATFEEFARLVEFQGKRVPEQEVDIAPYWMGFFGSRVELKKLHREASYLLMQAEKFATLESLYDPASYPRAELRDLWEKLAWSNHHDYLPGTSPDRVYREEQLPILHDVLRRGRHVRDTSLQSLSARINSQAVNGIPTVVWNAGSTRTGAFYAEADVRSLHAPDVRISHSQEGRVMMGAYESVVRNAGGDVELARFEIFIDRVPSMGFTTLLIEPGPGASPTLTVGQGAEAIVLPFEEARLPREVSGNEIRLLGSEEFRFSREAGWGLTEYSTGSPPGLNWLRGIGFDIAVSQDDGGMWRLGHEMEGCSFMRGGRARQREAKAEESSAGLSWRFSLRSDLEGAQVRREFTNGVLGGTEYRVTANAPAGTTVTALFETSVNPFSIRTATPYAWAERPSRRHYDPTFWPVLEWIDVSQADGRGLLFVSNASQGWHVSENGDVEMMITRNASLEKCQVLGAIGTDPDPHEVTFWMISHEKAIDAAEAYREALDLHQPLTAVVTDQHAGFLPLEKSFLEMEGAQLMVLKRAEIGNALVLRLFNPLGTPVEAKIKSSLREFGFKQVYESDAMEEPLKRLPDLAEEYTVKMDRHLLTLLIQ